ncbi:galactose/methyl galactoside ABC transporter permease MglC [Clostridium tarantellae]|uniref:Galactose/methyl galactoside ABC transporter permease MglC n=1 Tax=Clostridium tarantellae TaxID=39493 RepID=A0A6I1MQA2_9CLOT|nr:galactose/methyl galactoside ABC transporter permease MglC [Clostridium tarantellae]MPQ43051.1 galactose/methyl galactoside ABC transporter permease MglC [Clostridium tarantellae]
MANKSLNKKINAQWFMDNAIFLVLLALLVLIVVLEPSFLSLKNFTNILSQSSTRIIIALGIGGILITGGTDLSAGRCVGLAAVVSASLLQSADYAYKMYPDIKELPIIVPILLVMIIVAIIGILNGFIVAKFNVPPFIVTMGMQIIVYGSTSIYFDRPPYGAQPIGGLSENFTQMVIGNTAKIPNLLIFALIVTAIVWTLWNKTKFGKNMYAIGGNKEAAVVSGVNVVKGLVLVYMFAGLLYGFAGALEAGRVGSATNNTGNMYEFDAIAACVVGGVSLSGGVGTVPGIIIGVLIFQVINYGLAFIGVNPYLQFIVKGLIIICAVAIDMRKYTKKK